MLTRTRYVGSNITLLFAGALVCAAAAFTSVMTAGFGADPVHDFKSGAILCDIVDALLSVPIYLAMFRWCGVGSIGIWCVATFSLLICLITGMAGPTGLFAVLLLVEALICQGINTASEKANLSQSHKPL